MSDYHYRTVEMSFKDDFEFTVEQRKVIGYLSSWALGSARYAHLTLSQGRDNEIGAAYREKAGGTVNMYICAIEDSEGNYSTHS